MMSSSEFTEAGLRALEERRRSCLTCFHLRVRERGTRVICDVRPDVAISVAAFTWQHASGCTRRGRACEHWCGEDGEQFE